MENEINAKQLTPLDILERIDKIIADTGHIKDALKAIQEIPVLEQPDGMGNSYMGDVAGQAKAEAVAETVKAREATNQRMIGLLEDMYNDIRPERPQKESDDIAKLREISSLLSEYEDSDTASFVRNIAQQMFVKPGATIVR